LNFSGSAAYGHLVPAAGEEVRERLIAHYVQAAASLLREHDTFEPVIVCVLDPRDAEAAALLIALGRGCTLREAFARGEGTGHVPVVVMVTERALVEAALRETRPALSAEIASPVEMVGGVRVLCVAAGGVSFAVALVAGDAADDEIAAEVPAVVHELVETMGEEIRAAIDGARPDGRRQVAVVDVSTTIATRKLTAWIEDAARFAERLRREAPQLADDVAEPPELGFINVLFVLEDGGVFARPMRLASIVS
jgi:hypothetical protein